MITNAALAAKINTIIDQFEILQDDQQAWMNGAVGGGPNMDGRFNITDFMGNIILATSPLQLEANVNNLVTGVAAQSTAAMDAQTAAEAARDTANVHRADAVIAETSSISAKDTATLRAAEAATDAATALAQAGNALTSATTSAADAIATAADRVQTGIDAAAAAASAAAAATFDPALFATLTGATFTGAVVIANTAPKLKLSETGAAANNKDWDFVVSGERLLCRILNDAAGAVNWLTVERTGTVVDLIAFGGPLTATSYNGVPAANLLNKNGPATIAGNWKFDATTSTATPRFRGDGSFPQLIIEDKDSNGSNTRAFLEFRGSTNDQVGRIGFLTAASGIMSVNNDLPNAGVEICSNAIRFVLVNADGITVTGDVVASGDVTGSNLNVSNWDTAFGWGNHASAGYATGAHTHPLADITDWKAYSASGNRWDVTPFVSSGGVMEVGRFIDFHETDGDTSDNALRMTATAGVLGISGTLTAASFVVNSLAVPFYITSGYTSGKISVSATTPSSPAKGDIWFDIS